jgi:hypothetical protein
MYHHHHHHSRHKSQKSDELKITLSPSKQSSMSSFHKSTSAPTIGVSSNSSSYQVKIKTEKPNKSNYDAAASTFPYLTNPETLLSMSDDQQLQHLQQQLQQQTNNYLLPALNSCNQAAAAAYFAKMFQNSNIINKSPQQQQQQQHKSPHSTHSSPSTQSKKHYHSHNSPDLSVPQSPKKICEEIKHTVATTTTPVKVARIQIEQIEPKIEKEIIVEVEIIKTQVEDEEVMIVDKLVNDEEITTTIILDNINNNNDCTVISSTCSSNVDLDNPQQQEEEEEKQQQQTIIEESSSVLNNIVESCSKNIVVNEEINETTMEIKTTEQLAKNNEKIISPSSTITTFFNDFFDNDNSISSFSMSLKANKKLTPGQLWKTCGEPVLKLVSVKSSKPVYRQCYTSIIHEKENEEIKVFDCVLLRSTEQSVAVSDDRSTTIQRLNTVESGSNETVVDTPPATLRTISNSDVFIAKVSSFWRDDITSKKCFFVVFFFEIF